MSQLQQMMDISSYLFTRKGNRKKKTMEKHVRKSNSDYSLDSLEVANTNERSVEENFEIVVPFYEKDVIIKVPKNNKSKQKPDDKKAVQKNKKFREQSPEESRNYLVNKDKRKSRRSSYLEIFRKSIGEPACQGNNYEENDVRSLSPEVGDTEVGSFHEEPVETEETKFVEFYNTEAYNEIYYERLLNNEVFDQFLDKDLDEEVKFTNDIEEECISDNNLRSVSEVSQPRRRARRSSQPTQQIKLGGLGPDLESMKPKLERARSLQRYSEKIRMENRLKIYKKSVEMDKKKTVNKPKSKNIQSANDEDQGDTSYLQNKPNKEKNTKGIRNIVSTKTNKNKEQNSKIKAKISKNENTNDEIEPKGGNKNQLEKTDGEKILKKRGKSSSKSKTQNRSKESSEIPPVQISFLVNFGGVRPSTALRNLEEKHRMYQEQIKAFQD